MTNAIIKMNGNEFDITKFDSNALTISKAELANNGITENDKCYDIALQIKLTGKIDSAVAIKRCELLYELKKKAETDFKSYCEKLNIDNYSNCNKDALVYERILSNDEYKEIFKAKLCLLLRYLFAAVSRIVAELADEFHTAPDIVSDNIAELLVIHKADEVVLIGHDEITVNRIHPFDRKLHRPAAVQHAGIHVDM